MNKEEENKQFKMLCSKCGKDIPYKKGVRHENKRIYDTKCYCGNEETLKYFLV